MRSTPTGVSPANAAEIELVRALVLASARLMDEALESLRRAQDAWRRNRFDDAGDSSRSCG